MQLDRREAKKEAKQEIFDGIGLDSDLTILDGFECPILRELMQDPVIAADGHSYERSAIEEWVEKRGNKTSPLTGVQLSHLLLMPNHNLRKAIADFRKKRPTLNTIKQLEQAQRVAEDERRSLELAIRLREEDLAARPSKLLVEVNLSPSQSASQAPLASPAADPMLLLKHAEEKGHKEDKTFPQFDAVFSLYQEGSRYYELGNYPKALPLLLQAAELNYLPALLRLGNIYAGGGRGVAKNAQLSRAYYKKSGEYISWFKAKAQNGEVERQCDLGRCYENGVGVSKYEPKAVRGYRLAAEQGDMNAQYKLGECYDDGIGVTKDEREAVCWYRLAAEQGHVSAQFNLGLCYEDGAGVAKDEVEAVRWYRWAAEQGHVSAQFNLGVCYEEGIGVDKDEREAVRWYQLVAEEGDEDAQNILKSLLDANPNLARPLSPSSMGRHTFLPPLEVKGSRRNSSPKPVSSLASVDQTGSQSDTQQVEQTLTPKLK